MYENKNKIKIKDFKMNYPDYFDVNKIFYNTVFFKGNFLENFNLKGNFLENFLLKGNFSENFLLKGNLQKISSLREIQRNFPP